MPHVVATHAVKDVDHWLASTKRDEFFGPLGVTGVRTLVSPDDRLQVGLIMHVPDLDALMAALQTEAGAAAMEHDGVLPETLSIFIEE
jgi:hypothetical protein